VDSEQETRISGAGAGHPVFVQVRVSAWAILAVSGRGCDCETRGEEAHARPQGG
jgi:hypothetical protein